MILNWLLSKLILLTQSIVLYFIVPLCEIPTCFINTSLKRAGKIEEELVGGTCLLWLSIALCDPSLKVIKDLKGLHSCFAGSTKMKEAKVLTPCRLQCLLIIMYTMWLSQYIGNIFVFLARCPFKFFDFVAVWGDRPQPFKPCWLPESRCFWTLWPYFLAIPFPCPWASLPLFYCFITSVGLISVAH